MDPSVTPPILSLPPIDGSYGGANQDVPNNIPTATQPPLITSNQPAPSVEPVVSAKDKTPEIADDVDLIEKEWIVKLNQVIEETKNDPFEQAQRLSIVKSEYLQKRYNKTIRP